MIENKVQDYLKKKHILLTGKKILVGVSGGPDSLALLHFFWIMKKEWKLDVMAVHVDHMFRGEESLAEARYVEAFCNERNIPVMWKQINVPAYINKTGMNSQMAARNCRYAFFEEVMQIHNVDYLALGHHGDDQVETVLMRLTRGSSQKARAGIPFQRNFGSGILIRPFLCLERREIEEYCLVNELHPRRDPSNEKEGYSRNRFRKHVLPFLKKENAQVASHIQRFSEELEADEQYLLELAEDKLNKLLVKKEAGECVLLIDPFLPIAIPLQRRCIQLILNYLYNERPTSLSAIHTDQIIVLLKSPQSSGNLDLPEGLKVVKSYGLLHFQLNISPTPSFYYKIEQTGELLLPNGYTIKVEYIDTKPSGVDRNTILLDSASISWPLMVRSRKDGDRIRIIGMEGTKKVNRIFIDNKIPIQERDSWPIVTDNKDTILWVPGLKKSVYSISNMNSGSYLLITYKKQ